MRVRKIGIGAGGGGSRPGNEVGRTAAWGGVGGWLQIMPGKNLYAFYDCTHCMKCMKRVICMNGMKSTNSVWVNCMISTTCAKSP